MNTPRHRKPTVAEALPGFFIPASILEAVYRHIAAPFLQIAPAPSSGNGRSERYELEKRCLDLLLAVLLLAVLSPLLILTALLVRLTSPGPVLFRQQRVGKEGAVFNIYKFRTMYVAAPAYGYSPTEKRDPRVTYIGRFLRRSSLDELPQLINVLRGEMSLVGPRPEMPFIVERYTAEQRQRLSMKPGITGLWQISPHRLLPIHEHLEHDFYYMRYRSLRLDAAILLHTLRVAGRGV